MANIRDIDFSPEWRFQTSRSSGKGGQNVNKVESRVELYFNIDKSALLDEEQKTILKEKLGNRMNSLGELQLTCEEDRSQLRNKEIVIGKFYTLLEKALKPVKKRKIRKLPKAVKEARLKEKRMKAEKKENRRKTDGE